MAGYRCSSPRVVSAHDSVSLLIGQLRMNAVNHLTHLTSINEECLAAPVTGRAIPLVTGDEPEADRNLRGIEQLPWHGHHAVN